MVNIISHQGNAVRDDDEISLCSHEDAMIKKIICVGTDMENSSSSHMAGRNLSDVLCHSPDDQSVYKISRPPEHTRMYIGILNNEPGFQFSFNRTYSS